MGGGRDRIPRAAALLKEASSLLVAEEPTDMIAAWPNTSLYLPCLISSVEL